MRSPHLFSTKVGFYLVKKKKKGCVFMCILWGREGMKRPKRKPRLLLFLFVFKPPFYPDSIFVRTVTVNIQDNV